MKTYRRETGNLVAQTLGRDDGDVIRDALVGRKVERESRVVLLDDLARRLRVVKRAVAKSVPSSIDAWKTPHHHARNPITHRLARDTADPRRRRARRDPLGFSPSPAPSIHRARRPPSTAFVHRDASIHRTHLLDRLRANATHGGFLRSRASVRKRSIARRAREDVAADRRPTDRPRAARDIYCTTRANGTYTD